MRGPSSNVGRLRTLVTKIHTTRRGFTSFDRRRISRVFHITTLTTGGTHVSLTGVTITRANVNMIRSGIVGGRCTTRCVCGTCGGAGAYNILRRSTSTNVHGVTRPVNIVNTIVPAAGPASATVFGALLTLGAHGNVIVDPRPHTGGTAVRTSHVILRTTIGTNTPRNVVT